MTEHGPSTMVTDPTDDDACPGCGATHGVQPKPAPPKVAAWTCRACGMHWAVTTVVNPALSVVGLLPTPQLRTAALLAVLGTEVARRSGKGPGTMTVTVCFPATEVISIDAMASVDTVVWWCRLCDQHGTATTRPTAHSDGVEHLTVEHHANCRRRVKTDPWQRLTRHLLIGRRGRCIRRLTLDDYALAC